MTDNKFNIAFNVSGVLKVFKNRTEKEANEIINYYRNALNCQYLGAFNDVEILDKGTAASE